MYRFRSPQRRSSYSGYKQMHKRRMQEYHDKARKRARERHSNNHSVYERYSIEELLEERLRLVKAIKEKLNQLI